MELLSLLGVLVAFFASLLVVLLIHAQVVKFALKHNIVDVPDARKLQRRPVPVLGGVAVFFGLLVGLCAATPFMDIKPLLPMFVAMSVMLCVGVADDISGLSPRLRFLVEIAVVVALVFMTGSSLGEVRVRGSHRGWEKKVGLKSQPRPRSLQKSTHFWKCLGSSLLRSAHSPFSKIA